MPGIEDHLELLERVPPGWAFPTQMILPTRQKGVKDYLMVFFFFNQCGMGHLECLTLLFYIIVHLTFMPSSKKKSRIYSHLLNTVVVFSLSTCSYSSHYLEGYVNNYLEGYFLLGSYFILQLSTLTVLDLNIIGYSAHLCPAYTHTHARTNTRGRPTTHTCA